MCKMCYELGCQYVEDKVGEWEGLSLVWTRALNVVIGSHNCLVDPNVGGQQVTIFFASMAAR